MIDFKDKIFWQKSHDLVLRIYKISKGYPSDELYGITNQLRRAAVSIPNNIAEGFGRKSKKELVHFLNISLGSASEVEYLLILSKDLGYLSKYEFQRLNDILIEIKKMMLVYISRI